MQEVNISLKGQLLVNRCEILRFLATSAITLAKFVIESDLYCELSVLFLLGCLASTCV